MRNGELISIDNMDINHLRNVLKMLIKAKRAVTTPKPKFEVHGEIASEFADMVKLYAISPELTCTCDEVHECQQCYEERRQDADVASQETSIENSI
jgi:hypothetical protein